MYLVKYSKIKGKFWYQLRAFGWKIRFPKKFEQFDINIRRKMNKANIVIIADE